ncbi:MAG: sensor histidine kinase [Acidimicrobiales bacterium]
MFPVWETGGVQRGLLTSVGVFRVVEWFWMLFVLVAEARYLSVPWLAWALVCLAGLVTIWLAVVRTIRPAQLLEPVCVLPELAVGVALLVCDGLVFKHGHVFGPQSSLAAGWPLAGVLSAGIALGAAGGFGSGAAMGIAHFYAAVLNGVRVLALTSSQVVSVTSSFVLYMLVGAVAGYAVKLIRQSDDEVARARAREEVTRTLHDGVLQTLAFVERRVADPLLAGMAREQERELRTWLASYTGSSPAASRAPAGRRKLHRRGAGVDRGELERRLRLAGGRLEDSYGGRVDVIVAADVPLLPAGKAEAITGAVGEALVNSGKHGRATRVTVFVEPADQHGVFCSVKDDGLGMDVAAAPERLGISRSIRGRIEAEGGRVELASSPGRGTEVRIWV